MNRRRWWLVVRWHRARVAAVVASAAVVLAGGVPTATASDPGMRGSDPGVVELPAAAGLGPGARAGGSAKTCTAPRRGFRPTHAKVAGQKVRVLKVRRTPDGAVGAPPLSEAGKHQMGWDPQRKPGNGTGSVILVAHTWPDGSALGNRLLKRLRKGGKIVMTGQGGERACYRVAKRRAYRHQNVPVRKAFRYWGRERVVIVVCSGKRLGPGDWTHRTIWYARPRPAR